MTNTDFIASLPSVKEFSALADLASFSSVPEDWRMYCCDVVDSTKAIEAGRYKVVNMAGAACIMAAINAAGDKGIAFVFGGDGATIAAPASVSTAIDSALAKTKHMSREQFKLDLRVGAVPVGEIRRLGADVRIAMLELSPGNRTALFSGGGAHLTEALVKGDINGRFLLSDATNEPPDLAGLSCRWEPLQARYGRMLCILISATPGDLQVRATIYGNLLARIERILRPDWRLAQPVRVDNMRFHWPPRGIVLESRATKGNQPAWRNAFKLYLQSLFQKYAEHFDRQVGAYNAPLYRAELRANSDYRRFDDVLRMVIDVTPQQHAEIDALLSLAHGNREINYGTHCSGAALMTCLLFSLEDSRHIHFIDGADGGFTYAAKGLKAQLAAVEKPSTL